MLNPMWISRAGPLLRVALLAAGPLLWMLCIPAWAQSPTTYYEYARSSSFTYQANGQLQSETLEPDMPNLCLVTSYVYDNWGNKTTATQANCSGAAGDALFASRVTKQTWTRATMPTVTVGSRVLSLQAGQFPLDSLSPVGHAGQQLFDPRFGTAVQVTDANNFTVTVALDELGRKVGEVRPDGTSMVWRYCILSSTGLDTSTNSTGCSAPDHAPSDAIQYVQTWPLDTSGTKSGPWSLVYTDAKGRAIREVKEGFDGDEQPDTIRATPIVRDTVYSATGVKVIETQPYWFETGSSTNAGANNVGATKMVVDALGRPTTVYVADDQAANQTALVEFGSASFVGYGAYGKRKAAVTTMAYVGGKTTITNDLGFAQIEEKNPIGELVLTTDADGAQLVLQNDAFGNLRYTKDPLGNVNTIGYDYRGRKVGFTDRDAGFTSYGYNAVGDLVWQQTPVQRNKVPATFTTFTYDKLSRKIGQVDDEYTSTWTFDKYADNAACLKGFLCESTTSHGVRKRYWYDSVGRPTSERVDVTGGVSLAQSRDWDSTTGRLLGRTWPTGFKVKYGYTSLGHLKQISLPTSTLIKPLPNTPGGKPASDMAWDANKVIWRAKAMNAWGRLEAFANSDSTDTAALNTRIASRAYFDQETRRTVGMNTATNILDQLYGWDSLGRLETRKDTNGDAGYGDDVSETYTYDKINRLTGYTVAGVDVPGLERSVTLSYNALGMLLKRSDVGAYTYPEVVDGVATSRPHALKSFRDLNGVDTNYTYNGNGNLLTASGGKYRAIEYTSFNQPSGNLGLRGPSSSPKHTWQYDEQHARIKEVKVIASGTMAGTQTTWRWHPDNAGGLGFEYEVSAPTVPSNDNPATQQSRHYVSAAGQVVAVFVMDAVLPTLADTDKVPKSLGTFTLRKVEGWHVDHLGSLITTTDHQGDRRQRHAYDPFGQRRFTTGAADPGQTLDYDWSLATSAGTANGFTGHQHLDDVGLIHMNGRLFDGRLGVFVQADPHIQAPFTLQSYNRYGYCLASPMGCTDPTGFDWWSDFRDNIVKPVFAIVVAVYAPQFISSLMTSGAWAAGTSTAFATYSGGTAVFATVELTTLGTMTSAAVGGFAASAITSGTLEGATKGALSAAIFAGVGDFLGATGSFGGGTNYGEWSVQGVALHGVAGCVTSVSSGGKCGPGALSAAFSQFSLPLKSGLDPYSGTFVSAAIGGTGSVLGGGKFANGARTAAYGYLFNYCMHNGCTPTESGNTRDRDAYGRGDFGVSRDGGARSHEGMDFVTAPGEEIQAPIGGVVKRVLYPYAGDTQLTGIEIVNEAGQSAKIFYMSPLSVAVGMRVDAGDVIGYAQDLHVKYNATMTNHVHVEIRVSGKVVNPYKLMRDGP